MSDFNIISIGGYSIEQEKNGDKKSLRITAEIEFLSNCDMSKYIRPDGKISERIISDILAGKLTIGNEK